MEVEYAFLADAAQIGGDGKLYVLGGGIDQVMAAAFPALHPYMSLVVKFVVSPSECERQHRLEIELWEQDGNRIGGRIEGEFSAPRQEGGRPTLLQLVFNLAQAEFPHPGDYAFQILVNGEHRKTVPLRLEQIAAPASA